MELHDIDPAPYLFDVHDIDLSGLDPAPDLAAAIAAICRPMSPGDDTPAGVPSMALAGYQDAVLLPTTISIPGSFDARNRGSGALYNTQDIRTTGWRVGLLLAF